MTGVMLVVSSTIEIELSTWTFQQFIKLLIVHDFYDKLVKLVIRNTNGFKGTPKRRFKLNLNMLIFGKYVHLGGVNHSRTKFDLFDEL